MWHADLPAYTGTVAPPNLSMLWSRSADGILGDISMPYDEGIFSHIWGSFTADTETTDLL